MPGLSTFKKWMGLHGVVLKNYFFPTLPPGGEFTSGRIRVILLCACLLKLKDQVSGSSVSTDQLFCVVIDIG